MSSTPEKLIAVIVTYKSELLIRRCVEAALASGVDEVVIWDNSPDAETQQVVESLYSPDVRLFTDGTNRGFGGAINRAITAIGDDCTILLLNPDCIVNANCVLALRSRLVDPSVGLVAPRMKYPDGRFGFAGGPRPTMVKEFLAATHIDDLLPSKMRRGFVRAFGIMTGAGTGYSDSCSNGPAVDLFWVSGFCVMLRASVFRAVRGFDEKFFLYFEDVDLSIRIRLFGLRIVLERPAEALHFESTSTKLLGKSRSYRDGRRVYFRKHGSRSERLAVRLGW